MARLGPEIREGYLLGLLDGRRATVPVSRQLLAEMLDIPALVDLIGEAFITGGFEEAEEVVRESITLPDFKRGTGEAVDVVAYIDGVERAIETAEPPDWQRFPRSRYRG